MGVDDSFMNQAESFWFITDSLHGLHSFPLAKSRPWTSSLGGFESGYCFGCTCWANFVPSIFLKQQKSESPNISNSASLVNASMKYQKVSVFSFWYLYNFVRHPFLYLVDQWIFPVLVRGAQGSIESPNLAIYTSVNAGILPIGPIGNLKKSVHLKFAVRFGAMQHAQQH